MCGSWQGKLRSCPLLLMKQDTLNLRQSSPGIANGTGVQGSVAVLTWVDLMLQCKHLLGWGSKDKCYVCCREAKLLASTASSGSHHPI